MDANGAYSCTVTNSKIKAAAPILLRKATAAATLSLNDNTLTTTGSYDIIVTANDFDAGKELTPATGSVTIVGDDSYTIYK